MRNKVKKNQLVDNSFEDKIFNLVNYGFMVGIFIVTIYPFLNVFALSLSGVSKIGLSVLPKQFTIDNYVDVIKNPMIWVGYKNTLIRVFFGTVLTLLVSILTAYPLSKKELPFKKTFTIFVIITMFFNGGMIPNYILVRNLHLIDSYWALILPRLIDTFALIVMRNFFMTIPDSIEEAARVDGASYLKILFRIIVPISGPIIATVVLWTAVWHWNSWFDALIYIQDYDKSVLQMVLRRIIIQGTADAMNISTEDVNDVSKNPDIIKAATIIFSTAPIICAYPFLQKYFVKGMVVGAVKG